MEKTGQEWVSASVDGETNRQTLAELAADTGSHATWQRYHLIGDAMRDELPQAMPLDLSSRIAAALELEPTVLAPKAASASMAADASSDAASQKSAVVVPFMRQLGQYGIAAAVALMAVVGVQNYQTADETQPLPVLNTRPLVGTATPVSLQTGPVVNQNQASNEQLLEQRRRINAYLQDHMLQQRLNSGVVVDDNTEETLIPVKR